MQNTADWQPEQLIPISFCRRTEMVICEKKVLTEKRFSVMMISTPKFKKILLYSGQ